MNGAIAAEGSLVYLLRYFCVQLEVALISRCLTLECEEVDAYLTILILHNFIGTPSK